MIDNSLILIQSKADGEAFRRLLSSVNNSFVDVPILTKEDLKIDPSVTRSVETVFSTWYMPEFSEEEVVSFFPSLKYLFYSAGTVKYFATPFLKKGVRVFSAASLNGIPVAESVVAQIVLANKGYFLAQKESKSLLWRLAFRHSRAIAESHPGNYGSAVGLIGCGSVGRKVVELLRPYDLRVYVYDPFVSDEQLLSLGVQRLDLAELFSVCDVISNHLPDIPSTKGMLNASLFSLMKPVVTFINTGRGAQVVEKDLSDALRKRPLACALLDVTRHEPPFPWSSLLRRKNIFLTPHIAGSLSGEYGRLAAEMVTAWQSVLIGKDSPYEVKLSQFDHQA